MGAYEVPDKAPFFVAGAGKTDTDVVSVLSPPTRMGKTGLLERIEAYDKLPAHQKKALAYILGSPLADEPPSSAPKPVPSMIEDPDSANWKPRPATARTKGQLLELLRDLWHWCGRPSMRRIAAGSDGIFSHTTVNGLIRGTGKVPELRMEYLIGLVKGLGGSDEEVAQWVATWREIDHLERFKRRAVEAVGERQLRAVSE